MFGLDESSIEEISRVFDRYPEIEEVHIYGSRATGKYREGSDIDLTLLGDNLDESLRMKLVIDLDGLNLPWFFDVSILSALSNPELLYHISRHAKVFYTRRPG